MTSMGMQIFAIVYMILILIAIGCSIYGFILFIKLANRGIVALDIYIQKNKNNADSIKNTENNNIENINNKE